jgi:DNA-binding NarL/FixJ family response regulator
MLEEGNGRGFIKKNRVLLVDDHPLVRRGLADSIAQEADMEVCGEAADVTEAMRELERTHPDVVVTDLSLKSSHGLDLIEMIKARSPRTKILVSSMHDETLFAERVLQAGAMGYLTKQEPPETLIDAIRQVLRGEIFVSQRMTSRILHRMASGKPAQDNPVEGLSNRELQVYEMVGQGLTVQQIGMRLHISPKTVETHREKIKQKLNLKNSAELNRRAIQWILERGWSSTAEPEETPPQQQS